VCFLHEGVVVERGDPERIFTAPERPETQQFLRRIIEGGRLDEGHAPSGGTS
jgi:polar amino acid transport system ATP-binding protein